MAPDSLQLGNTPVAMGRFGSARARKDGLILISLGCLVFLLLGSLFAFSDQMMSDFTGYYYHARCLLHNRDPYNPDDALTVFRGERVTGSDVAVDQIVARLAYLPTIFPFTVPMALLPYRTAAFIFALLRPTFLIIAAFLMWDIGSTWWPEGSGLLLGFMLANSVFALKVANVFVLAISLCVIAVWCFLKQRLPLLGAFCMAASLALKPHDTCFVWLLFFLAGRTYRRRALETLVIFLAITLPFVLWVSHVGPHWPSELHNNLSFLGTRGDMNDEGPSSAIMNKPSLIISLQTVAAFFRDDPRFYNTVSYVVCGALLLVWAVITVRSKVQDSRLLFGLASISALSMLPVYHRTGDAKLLLLSVPACALLWAQGGRLGRAAFAITFVAFLATADLSWIFAIAVLNHYPGPNVGFAGQLRTAAQIFPAPLSLLTMSAFYLWVYARDRSRDRSTGSPSTTTQGKALAT